ncbi:MAG: hypothetical protein Q9181_006177 [Wetmoreana brouardii]
MPTNTTSSVSTFITNLRLLDLDHLDDWPDVHKSLFAAKGARENQRQRVRCVEWALYRLFEIWNSKEASNKLQPFFPPYESLRSLNLRAALLRWLTELKTDGALGKELVIRKTMFDECRGDKFEEILASFSAIVLQKAVRSRKGAQRSIAGRLATCRDVLQNEQKSLLPLAIAHQGALRALLHRKTLLRVRYANLGKLLDAKEQELLGKIDDLARADEDWLPEAVSDRTMQEIRHNFDANWEGKADWIDGILEGERRDVCDSLLDTAFSSVWSHAENGTISDIPAAAGQSLLQDLSRRVHDQQQRLHHWQKVQQDLVESKPKSPSKAKSPVKVNRTGTPSRTGGPESPLKFGCLEGHGTRDDTSNSQISPEMKWQYRRLLEYSHRKTRHDASGKLDFGKVLIDLTDATTADFPDLAHAKPELAASVSDSTVPTRPGTGTRTDADQSDASFQFAPRPEEEQTSITVVPDLHDRCCVNSLSGSCPEAQAAGNDGNQRAQQISVTPVIDQDKECEVAIEQESHPIAHTEMFPSPKNDSHFLDEESAIPKQMTSSAMNAQASSSKRNTSLTERTRQSMAFFRKDSLLPNSPIDSQSLCADATAGTDRSQHIALDRSSSLVERTRRSISLLPASSSTGGPPKSSHRHCQSRQYPRNQFETPRRHLEDLKELTPPDMLFSPDADYASIFKSRPKVATSPNLSPTLARRLQWNGIEKDDDRAVES